MRNWWIEHIHGCSTVMSIVTGLSTQMAKVKSRTLLLAITHVTAVQTWTSLLVRAKNTPYCMTVMYVDTG